VSLWSYIISVEVAAYLAGFNSCIQQQKAERNKLTHVKLHVCVILLSLSLSLSLHKRRFHHQKGDNDWEETKLAIKLKTKWKLCCCETRRAGLEKIQTDRFCVCAVWRDKITKKLLHFTEIVSKGNDCSYFYCYCLNFSYNIRVPANCRSWISPDALH